jgi:hypothetical protein
MAEELAKVVPKREGRKTREKDDFFANFTH